MKLTTLALTLVACMTVMPAQADLDAVDWRSAELQWNEEYDEYVAVPTLGSDIFQERLVWSDHYTDFVPVAVAYQAELRNYRVQLVWSQSHRDFVPRAMVEPCPKLKGGLS